MAAHNAEGRARRTTRQRLVLATGIGVAALLAAAALWLATGGRWFVVATPSMGTAAPVGTLLWVRPVDAASLHVGDFITFHPPGSGATYSHRILSITSAGIRTKGAITAPDPWTLHPRDIVGRVVLRWWAVGWLIRALPILVVGGLVVGLLRRRLRGDWRVAATAVGVAATVCVVLVVQRPLTNAVLLGSAFGAHGGHATYVSTGLLPIRLSSAGLDSIVLPPGAHGTLVSGPAGPFKVAVSAAVGWWIWALILGLGFVPGLWTWRRRGVLPET